MRELPAIEIPKSVTELDNIVAIGYRGSIATGTFTEQSDDIDLWRVYAGTLKAHVVEKMGLLTTQTQDKIDGTIWDVTTYELRHFFELLLKGNPNMLSLLMLEDDFVLVRSWMWKEIQEHKALFLAIDPFYRAVLGFCQDHYQSLTKLTHEESKKNDRIDKCGYDPHMAAHGLRWLAMAIEYIEFGTFTVDRTHIDGPELIELKNGEWSREQVNKVWAQNVNALESRYAKGGFPRPLQPNRDEARSLLLKLILLENRHEYEDVTDVCMCL